MYHDSREVTVYGLITSGVTEMDHFPGVTLRAGKGNRPVADRLHGRARGRAIVDAQVQSIALQNRVKTPTAEVRGDRRPKLQRRSEEGLLHGLAVRSVVGRLPGRFTEQHRLKNPALIAILGG
jgi:hypothetical protein